MELPNTSEITCNIIDKAIDIFSNIEDDGLSFRITTLFGKENVYLSVVDKCCLSLLLASLNIDSDVKELMNDFSIDGYSVLTAFDLDDTVLFSDLTDKERKSIYDRQFSLIIEGISNNCVFFNEENLVRGLLSGKFCGSDLVPMVVSNVLRENSFITIDNFEMFLNRLVSKKNEEYLEKNPEMKQKTKSEAMNNTNPLAAMFGFGNFMNQSNEIGVYLTDKKYEYNPVIGREKEMKKMIVSLLTLEESPLLIGAPGVGKSVLVEGLAYLIQNDLVADELKNKRILMVNTSELVRGCGIVGSLEEKVQSVLEKVQEEGNTIIFMDEIHTAMGAGASMSSNLDVANILKPYLSSGRIKLIGATTKDEFLKYVSLDGAFDRRFGVVEISEPDQKQLIDILNGSVSNYEQITGVKFSFENLDRDKVLNYIMEVTDSKSRKNSNNSANPALALSILKRSFSYAKYYNRDEVIVDDVVEAIMDNDRIYESVRQRYVGKLENSFQASKEKNKTYNKVIQFSDYLKK